MAKFISLDRLSEFKDKIVALLNSKVNKAGDTMTGDLKVGLATVQTNGYLIGTWLQTTADTHLGSAASKIAVLSDGWVYHRTASELLSDIGAMAKPTVVTGTLSAGSTSVTLSNSAITTSSVVDIYTDIYGVNPTNVTVSAGKVVLTFEAQSSAVNVRIEVK